MIETCKGQSDVLYKCVRREHHKHLKCLYAEWSIILKDTVKAAAYACSNKPSFLIPHNGSEDCRWAQDTYALVHGAAQFGVVTDSALRNTIFITLTTEAEALRVQNMFQTPTATVSYVAMTIACMCVLRHKTIRSGDLS